ncbi:hypothetical protein AB0230_10600 [Microbacterium sp. NPDC089190]|uniref:hypothetical protein n=1 Tax=Microbacterium sp. NPDC089190 TaxID=3155063 RepID=UPI00344D7334
MPSTRAQRGADGREQLIGLVLWRAVQARQAADGRVRRALDESAHDDVDPLCGGGGDGKSRSAELHAAVIAPEGDGGGGEADHGPIIARPSPRDAVVHTYRR